MKVFISWSKPRSCEVALALKTLIEECLAPISVWTSSVDMDAGVKWYEEIERHLSEAGVGILCITPENFNSPWVLFEAGAMLRAGRLAPYLVGLPLNELQGPLAHYQAVLADRDGTLALMKSINVQADNFIEVETLERRFDAFWSAADRIVSGTIPPLQAPQNWLGLEGVFQTRADGFNAFVGYLRAETEPTGPKKRLWIIGSSLQGFDIGARSAAFTIWDAIDRANDAGCLRVLLTSHEASHFREGPEEKPIKGQIKREIGSSLLKLIDQHQVRSDFIRLYPGTPTVSAIATSSHMLLNPYPYGCPAHFFFSLIAQKSSDESDIYNQYIDAHFERGWRFGRELSEEDKNWLDELRRGGEL